MAKSKADPTKQLFRATSRGTYQTVRALIDAGADVNAVDQYDMTPLMWAARRKNLAAMECLIDAGANLDAQDGAERTALHHAVLYSHAAVAELLLKRGCNQELKQMHGCTALDLAKSSQKPEELARLLFAYGAKGEPPDARTLTIGGIFGMSQEALPLSRYIHAFLRAESALGRPNPWGERGYIGLYFNLRRPDPRPAGLQNCRLYRKARYFGGDMSVPDCNISMVESRNLVIGSFRQANLLAGPRFAAAGIPYDQAAVAKLLEDIDALPLDAK